MGLLDGFLSNFSTVNRVDTNTVDETSQGIVSEKTPELVLEMTDDELLKQSKQWEKNWLTYAGKMKRIQDENEKYWKGEQYSPVEMGSTKRPLVDNRIFTAVETFLPIVSRQNPEPLVTSDNTEEGDQLADKMGKMLSYQADKQKLKLKTKKVMRFWSLYLLGVVKIGWDKLEDDINTKALRPQKIILEVDSTIDEDGYTGEYVGEYKKDKAKILVTRFPDKSKDIEEKVENHMDTDLQYIEWWTDGYVFWTMGEILLGKAKNPHWNYEEQVSRIDEFGEIIPTNEGGRNHFKQPKHPYIFLSIFNVGLHPFDDTSLIQQNLSLQDAINKRIRQIDKNVDHMNGGLVLSGEVFTEDQGTGAVDALRKGGAIIVPSGNVNDSYKRDSAPPLPSDVYNNLNDIRAEVDNIFGTHATTRGENDAANSTARGKILSKTADDSRIGFISDYLEQFVDQIFNYWVQMMYVYYDEVHTVAILGDAKSKEYVTLQKSELIGNLQVSVREGSLIPKDPMVKRDEAMTLGEAHLLDPITMFERLDYPNPKKTAEMLVKYLTDPTSLFPDLQAQQQQAQLSQAGQVPQVDASQTPSSDAASAVEQNFQALG